MKVSTGSTLVVPSVTVVTATTLVVHAAVLRCQNPTKLRLKAIYQVFVLGSRDNLDLCTSHRACALDSVELLRFDICKLRKKSL